ncbi:MAG: LysE family translocator [Candidatus Methylomirabilales bacterium]
MTLALAGFFMGFIGSMPISGPISLLVFHRGMLARYQEGWTIGLGGALAEGIYCALAIRGFSLLLGGSSFLEALAKGVGILLLFALGLYFLFARQEDLDDSPVAQPSASSWASTFCVGLSVAALNPTLILTWSAAVAMLYPLTSLTFHTYDWIAFAASVVIGIVAWFTVLLALLRRFKGRFPFPVFQRLIRSIGGGLILVSIVSAVRMILR